jgi:hypothetical protein
VKLPPVRTWGCVIAVACLLTSCGGGHARDACSWHVIYSGGTAGTGSWYARFTATNTSPRRCALAGYPSVSLYGQNGRKLKSPQTRGHFWADAGPRRFVVGPQRAAHFVLAYPLVTVFGHYCGPQATRARVDLPGAAAPSWVALPRTTNKERVRIVVLACRQGFNLTALEPSA